MPLFITSDSLLNGFHVLYEESILRLEQANARKLGGILKFLWTRLQTVDKQFTGKPQLVAAAGRRAKIVVAIAMQLLGEETTPLEPAMAALVKEEVKRIEAAQGQGKPAWLGPPDRAFVAVEYTRYRPRGFYTRNLSLATLLSHRQLVAVDPISRQQRRGIGVVLDAAELCHCTYRASKMARVWKPSGSSLRFSMRSSDRATIGA